MPWKTAIKSDELWSNTRFLSWIGFVNKNNKRTFDKFAWKKFEYSEIIKKNKKTISDCEKKINNLKLKKEEYYKTLTETIKEDRKLIKNKLDELNIEHKNIEKKIEELEKEFETWNSEFQKLEKEKEEKKQSIKNNPLDRKSRQRIDEIDSLIKTLKEQDKTKTKENTQKINPLKSKLSEIIYKEKRLNEEYEKIKIINSKTLENHPKNDSDFDYKIDLLKNKIREAKNENIEIEKHLKEITDLTEIDNNVIIDLTENENEKIKTENAWVSFNDIIQHSGWPAPKQIKYRKRNNN